MSSTYKEKLLKGIEEISEEMMPKFYRVIHMLRAELTPKMEKSEIRGSLRGIWKGSQIDERLFLEAKKSLFPYQSK